MPKIIAKTRVQAPKVNAEKTRRLFNFAERTKATAPHIPSPSGSFSRNMKSKIRKSLESGMGAYLLEEYSFEKGDKNLVDEIYNTLANERYNGIGSKDFPIPDNFVKDYYKSLENSNPVDLYLVSLTEQRPPFEIYLSQNPSAQDIYLNYVTSRPTWENWPRGGDSELSKSRIAEYNAIYDSLSESDKSLVLDFMQETGLPMESAIQMMTPEYYNFLRRTNTPFLTGEYITNGTRQEYYSPANEYKTHPLMRTGTARKTKYLKNYGRGYDELIRPVSDPVNINVRLEDIPREIDRFRPGDLEKLVNNVEYVGNTFPYANRLYVGNSEGYKPNNGMTNAGVAYGSFSPLYARSYADVGYLKPGVGRVHHVTVAGRPFIPEQNIFYNDPWGHNIHPEYIKGDDIKRFREHGYDWFGDFRIENQLVADNPYWMKNLVGNNGNFDTGDINWFHKSGGKVSIYKRYNPLRHK